MEFDNGSFSSAGIRPNQFRAVSLTELKKKEFLAKHCAHCGFFPLRCTCCLLEVFPVILHMSDNDDLTVISFSKQRAESIARIMCEPTSHTCLIPHLFAQRSDAFHLKYIKSVGEQRCSTGLSSDVSLLSYSFGSFQM